MLEIIPAQSEQDYEHLRELFLEYADFLQIDFCFRNIEREIASLPERYGPPEGCALLARLDDRITGCVGLRKFTEDICEMKRLYVRPAFRRRGIGKKLSQALVDQARRMGYRRMRLDSIAHRMEEAVAMYRWLGFKEIESYSRHPEEADLFMELAL